LYNQNSPGPSLRIPESKQTIKLEKHEYNLTESGIKLKLGVIDTPGFGDFVNNEDAWNPIDEYIEEQYCKYLRVERL